MESGYGRVGRDEWLTAEDFMRQEWSNAVGYAKRMGVPPAMAEDVVQDIFIRADKDWSTIKDPRPWVQKAIRNAYIDYLRARREISTDLLPDQAAYLHQGSVAETPHDRYAAAELQRELGVALTSLSTDERLCLLMSMNGSSLEEIALEIRRSPDATKALLCRTRQRIRRMLQLDRRRRQGGPGRGDKEKSA
ncbi:RNA polymerase sigma factor (sigma-70 family) [Streptomyces sp. SAI-208]|uniref:RNA polymerase sigma factor n=1 Tax=Streptomyces sp. SAI-208 TaxID=2940550 RepID=UPI002473DF7D|nr:sigma-70 family RNA polymerase sigma factor [Streptomyces sp. SAI-208]MDH6604438.1 RNA polymerase sigma factor (sigma-70 family) [Streptomyces sp. SAI-208]